MAGTLTVYDALNAAGHGVGWHQANGRPWIYLEPQYGLGSGWKILTALWWFERSQMTEDPPTFHEEWHRFFDYTPPSMAPLFPAISNGTTSDLQVPKQALANWTHQNRPYGVAADFYRSTDNGATWSFVDSGFTAHDTDQALYSSALYYPGDQAYANIYYISLDGNVPGPAATTPTITF